ncbi:MAG: DUF4142 domain-containing protein [Bacteroidia bacterium]|nr:DUF4142 domain-containing protein [Bacteroidia bacterium]
MKNLRKFSVLASTMLFATFIMPLNGSAQNAPKVSDPQIASIAVTANQIDVDYGKIALKKSKNESVRRFAQTMIDDHNGVIKMCVDLATKLGVTPETNDITKSLLADSKKITKTLNSKTGAAFDKAYIDNEVSYHEAVISTVENVLIPQAQNAELKALLVKVLPALKAHLEHAKMVQKEFSK